VFDYDRALSAHLDSLQPTPPRRPISKKEISMTTGTVAKLLPNGSCFICPDGAKFTDRGSTIFAHVRALARCGIASSDLMVGSLLQFSTKSSRFEGGKPEAFDIELIAA
jgi:hypothetical protein